MHILLESEQAISDLHDCSKEYAKGETPNPYKLNEVLGRLVKCSDVLGVEMAEAGHQWRRAEFDRKEAFADAFQRLKGDNNFTDKLADIKANQEIKSWKIKEMDWETAYDKLRAKHSAVKGALDVGRSFLSFQKSAGA